MIVVGGFLLALLAVPLLEGRLSRLGLVRFNRGWLVSAALGIQVPITTFAATWLPEAVNSILHLGTYGLALAFVWFNRKQVGMIVLVAGALCNLAAIAANGGTMPAAESAILKSGLVIDEGEFQNSAFVEDANLAFLGDVFYVPAGWPLANVFSIGDILLVLGGGWLVHRVCLSRLFPGHRRKVMVEEFLARLQEEEDRYEEAVRMKELLHQEIPEPVSVD